MNAAREAGGKVCGGKPLMGGRRKGHSGGKGKGGAKAGEATDGTQPGMAGATGRRQPVSGVGTHRHDTKLDNALSFKRLRDALRSSCFPDPLDNSVRRVFPSTATNEKSKPTFAGSTGLYGPQVLGWTSMAPRRKYIEVHLQTLSSRGPWLARRLCCPPGSMLTMASSEPLPTLPWLIVFVHGRLWLGVGPQFKLRVCSYMPPPVPRWTACGRSTVACTRALAFAQSAGARRPHPTQVGSRVAV